MTDSTDEGVVKVTVILPVDTVSKLDAMAKNSLLASRGRVIQSLVDEVGEVRATVAAVEQTIKGAGMKSSNDQVAAILSMAVALNDVSRRLTKFDAKST